MTRIKRDCIEHAREWTMLLQEVHEIEHGVFLDLGTAAMKYKERFPENTYVVDQSDIRPYT